MIRRRLFSKHLNVEILWKNPQINTSPLLNPDLPCALWRQLKQQPVTWIYFLIRSLTVLFFKAFGSYVGRSGSVHQTEKGKRLFPRSRVNTDAQNLKKAN